MYVFCGTLSYCHMMLCEYLCACNAFSAERSHANLSTSTTVVAYSKGVNEQGTDIITLCVYAQQGYASARFVCVYVRALGRRVYIPQHPEWEEIYFTLLCGCLVTNDVTTQRDVKRVN